MQVCSWEGECAHLVFLYVFSLCSVLPTTNVPSKNSKMIRENFILNTMVPPSLLRTVEH